jgi:hypothetical protein
MLPEALGLLEAAKRCHITIPTSCNTAIVTNTCHFMLEGIKIKNHAACFPAMKRRLFVCQTTMSEEESWVQSYEKCIPTRLIVAKETNDVIDFTLKAKYLKYQQEDELSDTDTSLLLEKDVSSYICPQIQILRCIGWGLQQMLPPNEEKCHVIVAPSNGMIW